MNCHTDGNPRLDRIEAIINARANRHNLIEIEFRRLSNAEDVLAASMKNVAQSLQQFAEYNRHTEAGHEKSMRNTDEHLNAVKASIASIRERHKI